MRDGNEKIDFVIPWVDGSDPDWQAEYFYYSKKELLGDKREVRYRDWGILKYWFRGVERFAPWVNKIYFVTWGHVPCWLNVGHPKLCIVKHEDYIPLQYLPTFNSHTIELNLHRITGLSEQFVYFNDDVFIVDTVLPDHFFRNGLPRDTFALNTILFGPDNVGSINGNNLCVINKYFNKKKAISQNWYKYFSPVNGFENLIRTLLLLPWPWFPGFFYKHTATNLLKSTIELLWQKEQDLLDQTCRCRFRQPVNVNQWLFKYWQLAEGKFIPISEKFSCCVHVKDTVDQVCDDIEKQRYKVICVNDTGYTQDLEFLTLQVQSAFQKIMPEKSYFEQ